MSGALEASAKRDWYHDDAGVLIPAACPFIYGVQMSEVLAVVQMLLLQTRPSAHS
jgi:hypothetical protein